MKRYDSVVIGAGPAGLTAAMYLCRSGIRPALVEALVHGGQLLKTWEVSNYPGFPAHVEGWNLADQFSAHLATYDLDRVSGAVLGISRQGRDFHIRLEGDEWLAKSVIIASGASPRKLDLPDEERLTGHGVSYCAMCDGMFFRDQVVAMVGGGNAALEEALYLTNLVKKLYLVHRRDAFRADKIYQEKLFARKDKIELVTSHVVSALHGEKELNRITVTSVDGGASRELDVNGLFVFVGMEPHKEFFPPELQTDAAGFVPTDTEMRTNIPGLFAAGDIRSKMCRQVATAVGDGATAAHAAFAYLEQLEA